MSVKVTVRRIVLHVPLGTGGGVAGHSAQPRRCGSARHGGLNSLRERGRATGRRRE